MYLTAEESASQYSCCVLRSFQEQKSSLFTRQQVIGDIIRILLVLQPRDNATSAVHAKENGEKEGRGLTFCFLSE